MNYNGSETFVCLDCRVVVRRKKAFGAKPRCSSCRKLMTPIGYKRRVPKKKDWRGWNKLREHLAGLKDTRWA